LLPDHQHDPKPSVLVNLLVLGIDKYLHIAMLIILVGDNMNGIAAVAAILDIVLIITADV
jgi:hypothetical protein